MTGRVHYCADVIDVRVFEEHSRYTGLMGAGTCFNSSCKLRQGKSRRQCLSLVDRTSLYVVYIPPMDDASEYISTHINLALHVRQRSPSH